MRIVFAGSIGRLPVGGHAWVDMNYLAGLAGLGHQVWYLEECGAEGSWVYNWDTQEVTTDLAYPTDYVRESLEQIGFGNRWIYRAGDQAVGMAASDFADVCAEADLLLVRGCALPLWRSEYELPATRVFVDSDPGFTQIKAATGDGHLAETIRRSDHLFTIGQRVGEPDCDVPLLGRRWERTLPPVWLPLWPERPLSEDSPFTSVLQWRSYADVEWQGARYGNKDREFPAYIDLPTRSGRPFRMALTGQGNQRLVEQGWEVVPGWVASSTPGAYQSFIGASRAEFSVAKHGYVATRGGWFSDRSVCYLASGRPVVVQDTGLDWLDWLGGDGGVLSFSDPAAALAAVDAVDADYDHHRRAARRLAETVFSAERVLPALMSPS